MICTVFEIEDVSNEIRWCDDRPKLETRKMKHAKWKLDGVRVIPGHSLDGNTAQTPGMDRKVAIDFARAGAGEIDGDLAVHARRLRRIAVERMARDHAHAIKFPFCVLHFACFQFGSVITPPD